ncbi:amidase [Sulfitobacter sabulilitoris]|uniref:Amidase n=1 Tax=Sulfitobacter sabulilitoris TaxID=2562655 RepID=A0A5S3PJ33_9RHOB|nr:amidase [Sulfitobacter sabulilitoris]TMM54414.1 amidase [Sulfitobacter sabulilitoris]
MDVTGLDAVDLAGRIAARELSAVEVMRATLERIAAVNPAVNAIVSLRPQAELLREAARADAQTARGPLHGLPIAIKDLADAAELPTSQGSPLFAGQVAAADDPVVARLRAAGAIVIGKTNTPEFGLGSHTYNPVHGATHNPYDLSRSAGGSSGGAAVALATGMLCIADGSDMMGSLRNPAAWNNVYGMRPTWGAVPSEAEGDLFLHQLSTSGPMARSPGDLALLLDVMAGPDPRQPLGLALAPVRDRLGVDPGAVRVGWLADWGGALPLDPGVLDLCGAALGQMSGLGWQVEDLSPPFDAEAMWESWITLRSFSVASGKGALYEDPAKRVHLKPAAVWEIERGRAMSGRALQAASHRRSDWFRAAMGLFDRFDVLALPSAQTWPFDGALDYPRQIAGHAMDTYHRWMQVVVPASLIGLPAVNIPAGFGEAGLPMGLQLIGRRGSDAQLLQIAERWHQATRWPQERPALR